MLRRSVTFYLVWMSCAAQAADALPQLKVDPSLVPQSRRPAATVKGTTPPKPGGPTAATPTAPAQPATVETVPVPAPDEVVATPVSPNEAVGTPAAATVAAPAAAVPAEASAEPVKPVKPAERAVTAVPAAPVDAATAPAPRNLPALKVDRALLRQPSSIARRAAPGVQPPDDIPVRGNVSTVRNMPPLKVDRALMGAPPVARRVKPAPAEGIAAAAAVPGAAAVAESGMPGAASLPSLVPEGDASQMMYGKMTLSEFVARNPDSRVTLLSAESVSGTTDEVMRAEGNAELRRPGTTLTADRINYEPPTEELQADGNVRLVRGEDRIEGPSLRYRLDRSEGVFEKPQYSLRRNLQTGENFRTTTGTGQADRMEFLGENRVRMTNATYSTCGPDNPDWYAKAETLDLNFESDDGEGRNGTIYFKDVPVLYSPWLDFSLNNRRKSGFLSPTFGTTNRTGFDFLLPYYWNIAPNMDATIAPRVLGTRGLMMSNEFRYLNHNYSGIARLDYLFSDRILDRDRHALSLQHTHRITNRLTASLNYNEVSDRNYYTDLGTRLAITSISYLPQDAALTYSGDWWSATARVTEYQSLANLAPLYSQMPAVTLNAFRADLPFGSVFQMKSSY
ncbi:MAG: LPS assembly protein LptD, partial [Methyloversatilis sp.]|nr:LPS assembly protein LptD [Methyloversatilis sp.]